MIVREQYLKRIRPFYHSDLIKVLTGMRRSGKSVLIRQIISELKQEHVPESQILYINFEDLDFSFIETEIDLHKFVKGKMQTDDKYYLFFDEIQNVKNFEKL
jgi:predicted AAA+ superfamily ATPase